MPDVRAKVLGAAEPDREAAADIRTERVVIGLAELLRDEFYCRETLGRLLEFSEAHRPAFDRLIDKVDGIALCPSMTAFEKIVKAAILVEETTAK